jgi:hypothetical protein
MAKYLKQPAINLTIILRLAAFQGFFYTANL